MKQTKILSMKSFVRIGVILIVTMMIQLPSVAGAEEIRVMTRNLYLGAEIQSLAASESYEEFLLGVEEALNQIEANNFPERAEALAAEIVEKKPHLIGLQEVYDFTLNEVNYPCPPFCNYLDELLIQLEAQGVQYRVAAYVINSDIPIYIPISETENIKVRVQDRDVILAREDVSTTVVNPALYCSPERISVDGCNYLFNATADIPADDPVITVEFTRSYAAVDAQIENLTARIVNTHLEVRFPDPTDEDSAIVQSAQAQELTGFLKLFPKPEGMPTILLGDINSSPEDAPIQSSTYGTIYPPYMQLWGAQYIDVWSLRPGNPKGFTCCYGEDLSEKQSNLYERIDVIFTDIMPDRVKANVVGNSRSDRTVSGLRPSDHTGVVGRLEYP